MGGGGFTGDRSVEWEVVGDNVRENGSVSPGPKRVRQSGKDETDQGARFTVTIKLPRDDAERTKFVQAIVDQLAQGQVSLKFPPALTIELPIEDAQYEAGRDPTADQIKVAWPSKGMSGA